MACVLTPVSHIDVTHILLPPGHEPRRVVGPFRVQIDGCGRIAAIEVLSDAAHGSAAAAGVGWATSAQESTLVPGFIDCHVHLTLTPDNYQIDHLIQSSGDKTLRALVAAQGLLRAGFTTVRSAGEADAGFPHFAVRRALEAGTFAGPTIVGAGHYISVTGTPAKHSVSAAIPFYCV